MMTTVTNKLRESIGMNSFKPGQTTTIMDMNLTVKSKLNNKKQADVDGAVESEEEAREKGPTFIEPIPGVNTSSFLGVNRERVVSTIVRTMKP